MWSAPGGTAEFTLCSGCKPVTFLQCSGQRHVCRLLSTSTLPQQCIFWLDRALPVDHVFGVPSHGREPQEDAGALIHSQVILTSVHKQWNWRLNVGF